jgi:hypothetical protein
VTKISFDVPDALLEAVKEEIEMADEENLSVFGRTAFRNELRARAEARAKAAGKVPCTA